MELFPLYILNKKTTPNDTPSISDSLFKDTRESTCYSHACLC